jgi:hypothetical protein
MNIYKALEIDLWECRNLKYDKTFYNFSFVGREGIVLFSTYSLDSLFNGCARYESVNDGFFDKMLCEGKDFFRHIKHWRRHVPVVANIPGQEVIDRKTTHKVNDILFQKEISRPKLDEVVALLRS